MDKFIKDKLDSFEFSTRQKELLVDVIKYVATEISAGNIDVSVFATKDDLNKVNSLAEKANNTAFSAGQLASIVSNKADRAQSTADTANSIAKNNELAIDNIRKSVALSVNVYTKEQTNNIVDNRIQQVVGAAPEALDTLEEIATRLEGDSDAIEAINGVLVGKADKDLVYSRNAIDNMLRDKISNASFDEYKETVYTKTDTDNKLKTKAYNYNIDYSKLQLLTTDSSHADIESVIGTYDNFTHAAMDDNCNIIADDHDNANHSRKCPCLVTISIERIQIIVHYYNVMFKIIIVYNNNNYSVTNVENITLPTQFKQLEDVYVFPGDICELTSNSSVDKIESILGPISDVNDAWRNGKLCISDKSSWSSEPGKVTTIVSLNTYDNVYIFSYLSSINSSYDDNLTHSGGITILEIFVNNKGQYLRVKNKQVVSLAAIQYCYNMITNGIIKNFYTKSEIDDKLIEKANTNTIPTKVSQLERDDIYIIKSINNLYSIASNGNTPTNEEISNVLGSCEDFMNACSNHKIIIAVNDGFYAPIIFNYYINGPIRLGQFLDNKEINIAVRINDNNEWVWVGLNEMVTVLANSLNNDSITQPLCANQGKVLNDKITALTNEVNTYFSNNPEL